MSRFVIPLLFVLVSALPTLAQTITLPVGVRGEPGQFIEIIATTDSEHVSWYIVDKQGLNLFPQRLQNDKRVAVVTSLKAGNYRVLAVVAKGDIPSEFAETTVTVGDPKPDDDVPPGPGPGPTPAGPRGIVVVYESAGNDNTTPQELVRWGATQNLLQRNQYLKSKGHTIMFLDDDQVGSDDKESPVLTMWKPHVADLTLPAVVIYELKTKKVIHKQSVPFNITESQFLEIVKSHES